MLNFILGVIVGGVIVFFVYGNNKDKANKAYDKSRETIDKVKEKANKK